MGDLVTTREALTGEAPFWEGTSPCSPLTLGRLGLIDASLFACCLASPLGEGDLSHIRMYALTSSFSLEESEGEEVSIDTNSFLDRAPAGASLTVTAETVW